MVWELVLKIVDFVVQYFPDWLNWRKKRKAKQKIKDTMSEEDKTRKEVVDGDEKAINERMEEYRKKKSLLAKENKLGGYRPHPNRGERYNDVWFDSKWEIRLAKDLDANSIDWERPSIGFVWNDNGNKYYPDLLGEK